MEGNASNQFKTEEVWLEDVYIETEEDRLEGVEELTAEISPKEDPTKEECDETMTRECCSDISDVIGRETEAGKSMSLHGYLQVKQEISSSGKHTTDDATAILKTTSDTTELLLRGKTFNRDSSSSFACYSCYFKSKSKKKLRVHVKCHGEKRFSCDQCNTSYRRAEHLTRHLNDGHGDPEAKIFVCEGCDFRCSRRYTLKRHLRTHMGHQKSFTWVCDFCDYRGSCQSDLKRHRMIHTLERPFACTICDFKFNQLGDLKTHERIHTGEKPYACGQCDYRSSRADVLKKHLRRHTGEKPYACPVCDYKCSRSDTVKTHMARKHPDVGQPKLKPYACDLCEYRSSRPSTLRSHMRTHTGEKPYACDLCDYQGNYERSFKNHRRTHFGEKPYASDHRFRQPTALKKRKMKSRVTEQQ